jgi:hypothetical protein
VGSGFYPTGCFQENWGGDDLLVNSNGIFTEFSSTNGTCTGTATRTGLMFHWTIGPVNADQALAKRMEVCDPRGYTALWPEGIYYEDTNSAFADVWACL